MKQHGLMPAFHASSTEWKFRSRFRRHAFGWRGSSAAVERIAEAISEIKKAARLDAITGAEGAIDFIARVSPAIEQVDSSSGALGSAVRRAIDELIPIIAGAPVDDSLRGAWLARLWKAFLADKVPYIEYLGNKWGELCGSKEIATEWADRLLPELIDSFRRERSRSLSYFQGTMACFSAMMAAGQYERVLDVVARSGSDWWHYRLWGVRALVAQRKRAEALRYAEASRGNLHTYDGDIARTCERILLDSGMAEEAYNRYAIAAVGYEPTYLGRFRALAKKYPWKNPADILQDLVATTPGNEGKWFAAAKSAGLYDEAVALAQKAPCDPKTLSRAARDFKETQLAFAMESALAALRWFADGYGYEITNLDVVDAYRHGLIAAERLEKAECFKSRASVFAERSAFVRDALEVHL